MEPKTKGQNLLGMVRRFEIVHGAEATARLHSHLDKVVEEAFAKRQVLAGGWYSLEWYAALHRAILAATGGGPEVIAHLAREQTKDDLSGVYKIFLVVLSPQFVIKKGNAILGAYYNMGRLHVDEERKGFARGRFTEFTGFGRPQWADMMGSAEGVLQAAGAKNLKTTCLEGGGDGQSHCTLEFRWE